MQIVDNIDVRLEVIETKLDKLTELITTTQLQEYRIKKLESDVEWLVKASHNLDKRTGETALKWLGIIGGGIISILLGYIAIKVGLKF